MDYESANKQYIDITSGERQFEGLGSEVRQTREYRADKWNSLCGLCYTLIEDIRFVEKHKPTEPSDRIHGEAFEAGISGRCADCEQDIELEAENAKLKEHLRQCQSENTILHKDNLRLMEELATHRWIPAEERLPDDDVAVLLLYEEGAVLFEKDTYHGMTKIYLGLTHWKPITLPE